MNTRDKIILAIGVAVSILGAVMTLLWSVAAGVIALLLLCLVILGLLILVRRQLARVQQRTLTLLKQQSTPRQAEPVLAQGDDYAQISFKKIIAILEAQQMSMEILNAKVDRTR